MPAPWTPGTPWKIGGGVDNVLPEQAKPALANAPEVTNGKEAASTTFGFTIDPAIGAIGTTPLTIGGVESGRGHNWPGWIGFEATWVTNSGFFESLNVGPLVVGDGESLLFQNK